MRFGKLLPVLALLCAGAASAQSLTGAITDSASRQPIPGVVISLLDSTGGLLGRMLTGERGTFHVPQAAVVRRLRLQRLGYRMREVVVPTTDESTIRVDIRLVALPSLLDSVQTLSSSQCPKRSDGPKAFSLLEQARAALLNTIVAREQNPGFLVRLQYQRLFDGNDIVRQYVRLDSETTKTSFTAVHTGADFVKNGFMDGRGQGQQFYGPDAETLLDDGFAAGYCFRIADADRKRPNQVGLAFSAASHKRERVDIDGTLWIDTLARALETVEYRFVSLPSGTRGKAEGMTGFRDMPNGVVFIDRWFIRLPEIQNEIQGGLVTQWWAHTEAGGEIARADWPDSVSWKNSLGTLRMLAMNHDSSAAPGIAVRLVDTDYLGIADKDGQIVITDLLPGPYKVSVVDTILAKVHILPDPIFQFVAQRDSLVAHVFEVMTAADYARQRCEGRLSRGSEPVLVLGKVENAMGRPVPDAVIEFAPVGLESFTKGKTGDDGVFAFCLPASAKGQAIAVWFRTSDNKKRNVVVTLSKALTTLLINVDGR